MRTILRIAVLTTAISLPMAGAQAGPQGSEEAQGYAQSWNANSGYTGSDYGAIYGGYGGYGRYGYGRYYRWR
jgi:hypothetical protein